MHLEGKAIKQVCAQPAASSTATKVVWFHRPYTGVQHVDKARCSVVAGGVNSVW